MRYIILQNIYEHLITGPARIYKCMRIEFDVVFDYCLGMHVLESSDRPLSGHQPILDQLRKPGGLALGFLAIILGLVTIFVLPEWKLSFQWFTAILIIAVAYAWISQSAIHMLINELIQFDSNEQDIKRQLTELKRESLSFQEPKVIQAISNPADITEIILLLQANRLFGQSMLVSIYYEDERGFEVLVASGKVTNVQFNGMIQITLIGWEAPYDELRQSIITQNAERRARLLVRPAPTISPMIVPDSERLLRLLASVPSQGTLTND